MQPSFTTSYENGVPAPPASITPPSSLRAQSASSVSLPPETVYAPERVVAALGLP
mgnify:CR=1 FL=1